ncbi:MAG: helix-turn-helix transcriptional regulator [Hydrococcus sp. SU_1_0]|nr:helix-turn-helix transcriptional regulator [Hydrococcus sp. SU_1_0]
MKDNSKKEKTPVRVFREELGLTRVELGRRIGLSERSLADIELGNSIPKLETVVALARECKKSLKVMIKALGIDVTGIPDDD